MRAAVLARTALPMLCLVWVGIAIGISFIEAPVKFTAPSLTLPVGLDVGRRVFAASHAVQLVLAALVVLAAVASRRLGATLLAALGLLVLQHAVLLPMLDERARAIIAGHPPSAPSPHVAYVAVEVLKLGLLLAAAWPRRHVPQAM